MVNKGFAILGVTTLAAGGVMLGTMGGGPALDTDCVLDDTETTAYKHQLAEIVKIDGSSIDSVSTMINCRLYRDVSGDDDYGSEAFGLEFDCHYEIDSFGSRLEYTK